MVTADAKGMHAIRLDNWKLIDNTPPEGFPESRMDQYENEKPQLYDLVVDPGEKNNLAAKEPEKVHQLKTELNKIRKAKSIR